MEQLELVLNATKRTETGKAAAKRLREAEKLPAVMYNYKGEATMLTVDEAEFTKVWKQATATTIIKLMVDGEEFHAFIKDTEYDILDNRNLHVDFHVINPNAELKATLKVQTKGTPKGVREGGILNATGNTVDIKCLPKDLPVRVVCDIDPLKIGESFCVKDIPFAEGIKVLSDPETVIVSVRESL